MMAATTLKRPEVAAPDRSALAAAVAALADHDAATEALRAAYEQHRPSLYKALHLVEQVESEAREHARKNMPIRPRPSGVIIEEPPVPSPDLLPFDLGKRLREARANLAIRRVERDAIEADIRDAENRRAYRVNAVTQAKYAVIRSSAAAANLVARQAELQQEVYDIGCALYFLVRNDIISTKPIEDQRFRDPPMNWRLEGAGAKPWIDFLAALDTDINAPLPE